MSRFAAIDVGSNAMRCLVAEVDETGPVRTLASVREPVRLGTNVFLTGRIGEAKVARTLEAFRLFQRLIETHGAEHVRAVATSAMREAADGPGLVNRIREETDIDVRIIDGAEEAHLVARAVADRLDVSSGRCAAVDVGGGSVEVLVLRDGDIVRAESFTVGAVRLLKALQDEGDAGATDFFALVSEYVDAISTRVHTALGTEPARLVAATGGSASTLAELGGATVTGAPVIGDGVREILLDDLREWTRRLARHSYRERIERFGLREDRADVILPAAVVYLKIGEIFGVDRLYVPGVGLKDGLILDMVDELTRRTAGEARRREIRAAALGLGRRYALDEAHATKVAELSLSLFDQTSKLHGLDDEARTLLETAALLHDVGLYISSSKHHKHSLYLIAESDLVGLDRRRRSIVANVARYHRKRHPMLRHPRFAALGEDDREVVRRLAAILRAADVLDREHRQHVRSLTVKEKKGRIVLGVDAAGDLLLERWAARGKFGLFEEVFGRSLVLED